MGLLNSMKNQINTTGGSKNKMFYVKSDNKRRIRFLQDCEDGIELQFHDSFEQSKNALCLEHVGGDCPYCEDETLRHRKQFAWCVWDYDANDVKILMYPANNYSPVPTLISMYETYGTLCDRDFVIEKKGSQQNVSYSVVPMDKSKLKAKAKTLNEKQMIKLIAEAFPVDPEDLMEEEDEFETKKGKKKTAPKKQSKKAPEPEDDDEDEDEELDYEEMSAKELYNLCKERGIKAKAKKDEEYYIELLEEYDEENEDEEDDDDEW